MLIDPSGFNSAQFPNVMEINILRITVIATMKIIRRYSSLSFKMVANERSKREFISRWNCKNERRRLFPSCTQDDTRQSTVSLVLKSLPRLQSDRTKRAAASSRETGKSERRAAGAVKRLTHPDSFSSGRRC